MNWDAIGAIGQAVSALALFGVFIQVRHARDEVQRSISHNRLDAIRQLLTNRVNNERLQGIAVKAVEALGGRASPFEDALIERATLTRQEATTLALDMNAYWQCQAEAIPYTHQFREGERIAFDTALRSAYGSSALGALWYNTQKPRIDPEAARYVDNLLAQPG